MQEIWKIFPESHDILVSNQGRVKKRGYSIVFNDEFGEEIHEKFEEVLLSSHMNDDSETPGVYIDGRLVSIHQLVAKTFIPNPNKYRVVKFINGDKSDVRADNLYWTSNTSHLQDSNKDYIDKFGGRSGVHIKNLSTGQIFPSITKAAEYYGISAYTIRGMVESKYKNKIFEITTEEPTVLKDEYL